MYVYESKIVSNEKARKMYFYAFFDIFTINVHFSTSLYLESIGALVIPIYLNLSLNVHWPNPGGPEID